jgi:hypothetical protein
MKDTRGMINNKIIYRLDEGKENVGGRKIFADKPSVSSAFHFLHCSLDSRDESLNDKKQQSESPFIKGHLGTLVTENMTERSVSDPPNAHPDAEKCPQLFSLSSP